MNYLYYQPTHLEPTIEQLKRLRKDELVSRLFSAERELKYQSQFFRISWESTPKGKIPEQITLSNRAWSKILDKGSMKEYTQYKFIIEETNDFFGHQIKLEYFIPEPLRDFHDEPDSDWWENQITFDQQPIWEIK